MSRNDLLLFAALVVGVIGLVHSILGERVVLPRLFSLPDLPLLRRDRTYTVAVLRYAWHVTSLAWWGSSATLAAFWWGAGDARHTALIIIAAICGDTLVWKPSELTPRTSALMAEMLAAPVALDAQQVGRRRHVVVPEVVVDELVVPDPLAGRGALVVRAGTAVVAHAVHVVRGRGVRLGRDAAAVRPEREAEHGAHLRFGEIEGERHINLSGESAAHSGGISAPNT